MTPKMFDFTLTFGGRDPFDNLIQMQREIVKYRPAIRQSRSYRQTPIKVPVHRDNRCDFERRTSADYFHQATRNLQVAAYTLYDNNIEVITERAS